MGLRPRRAEIIITNIDKNTLISWRLDSQKIVLTTIQKPLDVVAWLGGVQAQDYRGGLWSIGLRTAACNEQEVEGAIRDRQIVRTWMFRGTLHFIAARDLAWLTKLLAPGILRGNARRYRQLELDTDTFIKSQATLRRALEANGPLTRAEIKRYFMKEGIPAEGQQLPYLIQRAALDGLICQDVPQGSEQVYTLLPSPTGALPVLDRERALGLLAKRYIASHGPAKRQDLAWWAGLTARETKMALEAAPDVKSFETSEGRYWIHGSPPTVALDENSCLLPPFDTYLLGYKDRSLVLDANHTTLVNAGGGMLKPTVMVNGAIVATWQQQIMKKEVRIHISLFSELASPERDLIVRATSRFGTYQGKPFVVHTVSPGDLTS